MKINLYAVRDTKSMTFGRPFLLQNDEMAMRSFMSAVTGADEPMSEYPDDYTLYRIGEYDDTTGLIEGHNPDRVCTGLEMVAKRKIDQAKIESLHREIEAIKEGEPENATH